MVDTLNNSSAGEQSSLFNDKEADNLPKQKKPVDARTQLRLELQAKRQAMDTADVIAKSEAIATHLKPLISSGSKLAGYLALGNEVLLDSTLIWARTRDCTTYVPIVEADNKMVFAPYHEHTKLLSNQFGIREPDVTAGECLKGAELDTVLVPLVGFDPGCQRMGMGGGYYLSLIHI